jgi:hypothetical protein
LRVPDDLLGKPVRCPSCKATFTAHAGETQEPELLEQARASRSEQSPQPSEDVRGGVRRRMAGDAEDDLGHDDDEFDDDEEEYEDERRPRRRRKSRRAEWSKVRTGVTLVAIGAITQLVAIAFFAIAIAALVSDLDAAPRARDGPPAGFVGTVCVAGVLGLASFILNLVGGCLCVYVPPFNGARTLAITSLVLLCVAFLLACGGGVAAGVAGAARDAQRRGGGQNPLSIIANFISLAQMVVFVVFMRQAAVSLGERGLARSIVFLLVYAVIAVVTSIGLLLMLLLTTLRFLLGLAEAGARPEGSGGSVVAMLAIVGILLLGMIVWYIVSLFQLRGAITRYVDH